MRLPEHIITDVYENESVNRFMDCSGKRYFPVYDIPEDACFVIRQGELDKLLGMPAERFTHSSSSRLSTPLSRLFWLACKHNGLPDFDDTQRLEFLALDESELALASSRQGLHAQIYCILQIAYFKAKHLFFRFGWSDVKDDCHFILCRYFHGESLLDKSPTKHER